MLVRGATGLLLAVSGERIGAAGSSGSSCGGGAGNGPGVSCARNNPGAANPPATKKQDKTTTISILHFIIILTRAVAALPARHALALSCPRTSDLIVTCA
jgi:hypothetical protein